jgi:hypothetical protein
VHRYIVRVAVMKVFWGWMEPQCIIVQTGTDIRDRQLFVLHAVRTVYSFLCYGKSFGVFLLLSHLWLGMSHCGLFKLAWSWWYNTIGVCLCVNGMGFGSVYLWYTGWSESHATHIKIFIYGCNSVQFDWINRYTVSLWLFKSPHRSHHVVIFSHQSISCLQTVEVQGCLFLQVQQVFIVKHCLAYCSYLTCQNEFRNKFPDSPVPHKLTVSRLVNSCHD